MDAIIAGLPETTNGQLFALGDSHEQNVVTLSHIAAAKEKGWTSYLFIVEGQSEEEGEDYGHWEEYVVPSSTDITVDKHSFPDDNFRSWVLEQDYGKDGVLTEEEIAAITHISVCGKNISDLTGIEHFTALTYLTCFGNQLASLDVSNNTALTELDCEVNQLTSLDVSNNTALTGLICFENQLTSLDVSNNTALTLLHCGWNPLTSLDVSNNIALTELYCHNNQLTSLDVSNNTALAWLWCFNNQIKGAAMDALIAGLPDKGGGLYAIDDQSNFYNEQNVVTKAQVTAAKEKGWITYYYDSKNDDWLEYEGDETDGIEYNNREATATIYYNLNGQRVSEPIKGVFIRGGKKVLVK